MSERAALTRGHATFVQMVGPSEAPRDQESSKGCNAQQASAERQAIPAENLDAYKKVLARAGDYVHMLGAMIGSSSVRVMRESIQPVDRARICWPGEFYVPWPDQG